MAHDRSPHGLKIMVMAVASTVALARDLGSDSPLTKKNENELKRSRDASILDASPTNEMQLSTRAPLGYLAERAPLRGADSALPA